MKRIVFLAVCLIGSLLLCTGSWAQWKYEEYTNMADGAQTPLADGRIIPLSDPLLAAPNSKPAVTAVNEINNIVSVAFNEQAQFGSTLLPDTFSITVNTTISVLQTAGGTPATTTRSFVITYSKNFPYKRSDIFYFSNGRQVDVTINSIVPSTHISDNLARSIIKLTNDMRIDRSYTTDCTDCGVGAFNSYTTSITGNTDVLPISWPANKWARAYDLEWTFVSNEAIADNRYGAYGSAAFAQNAFRNNATRVTINELTYNIPLLFNEDGKVVFRYRAVQQLPSGERLTSRWSPEYDLTNGLGKAAFNGHQNNLTWQASTTFSEEGKLKSVVQYFDGTLKGRQSVTKDNVSQTTTVGALLYDYQGRAVINVLPAPTLSSVIEFTPLANTKLDLNAPGSEYTKDLYDGATTDYCDVAAPGMGTDAGASQYYSQQNPLKQNGINRYIPDAETFPFSETKYTQDNTGRVVAQGGLGKEFRLGAHDTRYFYASASQNDLDALFGTDVGDAAHYQKNMVRDANGQYTVTYVDMKGRTVATALAGANPDNLTPLGSFPTSTTTEALLTPVNNIVKGNSVVFTRTLLVPRNTTGSQNSYTFTYTLNPQTLKLANWAGADVCYDCLYDLTITIIDECNNKNMPGGVPYVYKKSNFSLSSINSNCSDPSRGLSESFSLPLPEGSYTVTKELSISQAGKEYYRDNIYMPNNLKTTFEDIYHEQSELVKQQLGDCNTNGDIAKDDNAEVDDYAQRMYAQMTGDGVYAQKNRIWYNLYSRFGNSAFLMAMMLRRHPEYQVYSNFSQLVQSNKWDEAMSKVNTYSEAVQAGYLNPLQMTSSPASAFPAANPDPFYQNNPAYKSRMTDSLTRAMITRVIYIFGRPRPVEWANLWSLSNMLVKCGIQANGGMDATCIAQYMNSANVYNPSVLCETELDDAWNKFKAIYLAKKKMMISDFLFSQGYPVLDNDSYRIFIDPRRYITQQELGINPYETDPSKLQQQAQDKVTSMIDQNCRNYAAYWWSRFKDATACSFVTERDSAAIVD
ncbi:hypothetical protein, partial [Niastella vici]|uniref:hypothetical protein n=1 Tax=Niastella vici TaxID=1703345 RepID=UPI00117DD40E